MEIDSIGPFPPRWSRTEDDITEEIVELAPPQDEAWREEQFLNLGIDQIDASCLARLNRDWHQAKALIDDGCPTELAVKILL